MQMSDKCSHCGLTPHKGCIGGHIIIDVIKDDESMKNTHSHECPNMRLVRQAEAIKSRMTPEMLKIPHVTSSPLYKPRKAGEPAPSVDRTKENLFITGVYRSDLLAHLKLIVMCQPFTYKVIDDSFLLDVYLGNHNYKSIPSKDREDAAIYNSVVAISGEEIDLLVMVLGVQGYKNKSSADTFFEALKRRREIYTNKYTWLLEPPGSYWSQSKNMDSENYVNSHYKAVCLTSDKAPEEDLLQCDEPEEMYTPPKKVVQSTPPTRVEESREVDSGEVDITWGGPSKGKYKGRKY